ncbi:MAG: hypothetical protein LBK42_02080 [Propionibacteriaceae bacterium]|jgi:hypothetical protein|nr:hypothetical protein [Propionibacteriaceae bacterium]
MIRHESDGEEHRLIVECDYCGADLEGVGETLDDAASDCQEQINNAKWQVRGLGRPDYCADWRCPYLAAKESARGVRDGLAEALAILADVGTPAHEARP